MEYLLNKKQKKAVEHFKGAMLVLAGPGSGKTTVITYRIKNLIEKYLVPASKILVITFTKSAANEMEKRFNDMNVLNSKNVTFGTFHSIFFKILRYLYGYSLESVISNGFKWNFIKQLIKENNIEIDDEDDYINNFFNELGFMKSELLNLENYNPINIPDYEFKLLCRCYEKYKYDNNKIDFDDMVYKCNNLLLQNSSLLNSLRDKYEYILIDEFQDINKAQYECIKMISKPKNNIFVVGDDDQSIYSFRGSRPDFILNFNKHFQNAKIIVLDINYRSTENIIKFSKSLIKYNKKRYKKNIKGVGKIGNTPKFLKSKDFYDEAENIAKKIEIFSKNGMSLDEIAIIYRTNTQGNNFVRCFTNRNIRYNLKDNILNIYEHFIANDIISYMKLSNDIMENECAIEIINKPKRYISKDLISQAQKLNGSFLENLYNVPSIKKYQREKIEDLFLHINQIKKRKPYEAIKYIRNVVPYDEYLQNYSEYRKIGFVRLREIADEITEIAKDKDTFDEFFRCIYKLSDKINEDKKSISKPLKNAITLLTLHSSKGLEFDTVFIPTVIDGIIPHKRSKSDFGIEEERRLFYVGVTRAKKNLYISEIEKRHDKKAKKSPFIDEIQKNK